jgi:hypothetical protein
VCQTTKHNDDTSERCTPTEKNWRHELATVLDAPYVTGLYPGANATRKWNTWRKLAASLATSRTAVCLILAACLITSGLALCMRDNSRSEQECELFSRYITGVETEHRFLDGCYVREKGQTYPREQWIQIRTRELTEGTATP